MRVLVVRLGAFGDIIHTLPLAADCQAAGHTVHWLCEDRWRSLLVESPAITRLHLLPRGRWQRESTSLQTRWRDLRVLLRELRAQRFDVAIDAQGLAKSAGLAALAGARRRIGHARPRAREGAWLLAQDRVPPLAEHVIDHQRALALPLGLRPRAAGGWRFPLPAWTEQRAWAASWTEAAGLRRPWLLNVGAGWPSKVWPRDHQIEWCRRVRAAGHPLLVLWGSPAERAIAEAITQSVAGTVLAPPTDLPQLAGLIAQGSVLVSGDTGPLHLARALGTPAVGLFGPVPGTRNGPRGPLWDCVQAPGEAWERRDAERGGMHLIEPDTVLTRAEALVARAERRGAS